MKKFNNPLDPDDLKIRAAIKLWTIDFLKLETPTEIEIIEHLCTEASCLHAETVIKVENTEGSSFFKIAKPLKALGRNIIVLQSNGEPSQRCSPNWQPDADVTLLVALPDLRVLALGRFTKIGLLPTLQRAVLKLCPPSLCFIPLDHILVHTYNYRWGPVDLSSVG